MTVTESPKQLKNFTKIAVYIVPGILCYDTRMTNSWRGEGLVTGINRIQFSSSLSHTT